MYKIDQDAMAKLANGVGAGQEKVGDNLVFQFDGVKKGRNAAGRDVDIKDTH